MIDFSKLILDQDEFGRRMYDLQEAYRALIRENATLRLRLEKLEKSREPG